MFGRKRVGLTIITTIITSSSSVLSVYLFYHLFDVELRLSEIVAALIIPLITTPIVLHYAMKQHQKIHDLEKDIVIQSAALGAYKNATQASNHIINNLMNVFQLFMFKLQRKQEISDELIENFQDNLQAASQQMKVLNQIENPLESGQYHGIYPDGNAPASKGEKRDRED